MKRLLSGALSFLLSGMCLPVAADTERSLPELRVEARDGKLLTVRSTGAPLFGVLWAISAQTGIRLNVVERMVSEGEPVVEDFADRPLKASVVYLLERYLNGSGYTLVTNAETGEVESVYVFSNVSDRSSVTTVDDAELDYDDGIQPPADSELSQAGGATLDPLEQALEDARAATDPRDQIEAMQVIANHDDPRVLEVLLPALQSAEPDIRRAALEAIPWTNAEASSMLDDVRILAAEDPEPAVRQAAALILAQRDDSSVETLVLLEELALDEGISNRDVFQQELDRIEEEEVARSLPDTQGQSE